MTANQKPPGRPLAKAVGSDAAPAAATPPVAAVMPEATSPSPAMQYSFDPPKWIDPNDYRNATIPACHACDLVNSVMDVVAGVETVMELIAAHDSDDLSDAESTYLSPFYLGNLNRLSIFALHQLGNEADRLREVVQNKAQDISQ